MEYIKKVKLELDREYLNDIKVMQKDSARTILFSLYANGSSYSLVNKTVRAWGVKPDRTKVFVDLIVVNASNGTCKLRLTNNMLAVKGQLKLMLTIAEGEDILSTIPLVINIAETLKDDNAIESTNEFTALENALSSVQEWDDYFLETSGNIEEKYTDRLNSIDSKIVRKFKPKLGIAQWWIWQENGVYKASNNEKITEDIERFKAMGIEEMTLCVYASYNTTTNEWYMIHSGAVALHAYNECKRVGIKVNVLKFMIYGVTKADTLGQYFTSFKEFITDKVNSFCSFFSSKGCELDAVTVLNELPNLYNKTENKDFVLSLLQIPKNYNYKASISMTSVWEYSSLSSDIINALDVFCFNCYPTISYNGEQASLEEAIQAWDKLICGYKSIKQRHSDKEIIITETGCQDRYEALINPAAYNWTTDYPNTSNGKAPALFLKGFFESDLKYLIKSFTYWFFDALYDSNGVIYKDVDKVIREYIKGVDD